MADKSHSDRRQQYIQQLLLENPDENLTEEITKEPTNEVLEVNLPTFLQTTENIQLSYLSSFDKQQKQTDRESSVALTTSTTITTHNQFEDISEQSTMMDLEKFDSVKYFEKMETDLSWNTSTNPRNREVEKQQDQAMEDPILSPNINVQLTTTDKKTCLIKDIQTDLEKTPEYLTKHNPSFQQMAQHVHSIIIATTGAIIDQTNNKDIIRKLGLLVYKIIILQMYHRLWTTYLKSGSGQLCISANEEQSSYPSNISIWSKELKTLILSKNQNKTNQNELYNNFVQQQLNELDQQLNHYQNQFNLQTNQIHGYTLNIYKIIETYIEENLQTFRMKIEHQIELIHHDYHIYGLKLKYLQLNPNEFQVQLMKELCQSKYDQEASEQEYQFLQKYIHYMNTSPNESFESSPLAQSTATFLESIEDNNDLRQRLFQQYKTIAIQGRNEIFQMYLKSAEKERQEYRKKHEDNIKKMWYIHHHPIDQNQTISSIMIQLINQRCQKIDERIQCIYKYKAATTFQ